MMRAEHNTLIATHIGLGLQ